VWYFYVYQLVNGQWQSLGTMAASDLDRFLVMPTSAFTPAPTGPFITMPAFKI